MKVILKAMLHPYLFAAALAALGVSPSVADAQGTPRPQAPVVPPQMMPPAGKCRIWMDGVAPTQQPAPTDCHTALRQKPANGTVIFGPTERDLEASGFRSNPQQPVRSRRDTTKKPPSAARRPEPTS